MSTPSSTHTRTDLVLRFVGGQRDGELSSISTRKCFVGNTQTPKDAKCAFFRGPAGATVRCYSNEVLINGSAASVHWLEEGDQIQLNENIRLEIVQLGQVEPETKECGSLDLDQPIQEAVEEETPEKATAEATKAEEEIIVGYEAQSAMLADGREEEEEVFINDFSSLASSVESEEAIPEQPAAIESRLDSFMNQIEREQLDDQTADELTTCSFDESTHSPNEAVGSSAETSLSHHEVTSSESAPHLDSVEQPQDSQEMSNPETTENGNSLQDVLARMKESGQWDGIPDENESVVPPTATATVEQPVVSTPAPAPTAGAEEDVEDYMSQLLNRMRGGEAAPAVAATNAVKPGKAEPKDDATKEEKFVPPLNPLKPEEFKPKQKAKRAGSFEAMREIANSSARTAVQKSDIERRKALAMVQVGIAIGSFVLAAYYYLIASAAAGDLPFLIGVVCSITAIFFCLRCINTFKLNQEAIEKAQVSSKDTPEIGEEIAATA